MKSYIKILGLGLFLSVLIGGCSSPYYTDIGINQMGFEENQKQDDIIQSEKLNAFIKKQFPNVAVLATSDHFNVLLAGQVDSADTKTKLVQFVKAQNEVKKVFDYTTISATPKLKYSSSLTDEANNRIATEYNINTDQITVIAVGSVVYVMGTNIGDLTSFKKALDGVAASRHVRKVVNLVQPGKDDYYSVSGYK